jgi:imidazolonepropionase-like amidohydrolase
MNFKLVLTLVLLLPLVGFSAFPNENSTNLILNNVNVIDGKGGKTQGVDIVIRDGVIYAIRPHIHLSNTSIETIIDLSGCFVIPGLIDGHQHITPCPEKAVCEAMFHGITSLRDMGGDGAYLKELQDAIESGELSAPDIYFSAIMGGPDMILKDVRAKQSTPNEYKLGEAPWMRMVDESTNIKQIIVDAKKCGATGIKMYADLSAPIVTRLIEEAHRQEMKAWSHAYVGPASVLDVVKAGPDVISHVGALLYPEGWDLKRDGSLAIDTSLVESPHLDAILRTMKKNSVALDPTLAITLEQVKTLKDPSLRKAVTKAIAGVTKRAYDYGIPIVAGTDFRFSNGDVEPLLFQELEILVNQVGLTPYAAIQAATMNAAESLGISDSVGSIEIGKIADLVVLKADPTINISNLRSDIIVIKNGRKVWSAENY